MTTQGSGEMNVQATSSAVDRSASSSADHAADSHRNENSPQNIQVHTLFEFPIAWNIYRKNNKCKENFYKVYLCFSQMSSEVFTLCSLKENNTHKNIIFNDFQSSNSEEINLKKSYCFQSVIPYEPKFGWYIIEGVQRHGFFSWSNRKNVS